VIDENRERTPLSSLAPSLIVVVSWRSSSMRSSYSVSLVGAGLLTLRSSSRSRTFAKTVFSSSESSGSMA
jgi:hypothetical protein